MNKVSLSPHLSPPARILLLLLVAGMPTGCASTFRTEAARPVDCASVNIFARAESRCFGFATIGILPFKTPFYADPVARDLAAIYQQELMASGVFRQVVMIPHKVADENEALWWGRHEQCSLIMLAEVVYLLDGSGVLSNRLDINVKILDARSGQLLWDFLQSAGSHPGEDIDLGWTTISGKHAKGRRDLARGLAQQASRLLMPPPPPTQYATLRPAVGGGAAAAAGKHGREVTGAPGR